MLQRTTERGIVTLYQYTSAGQLERVDYSDDKTAPVVYGYNRLGQNSSVVNGDSTTINEYNAEGALLRQSISGGPLDGITLEQTFNDQGQREQFTASLPHNLSIAHHYGYDDKGRMASVRQDDRQATYTYDDETGALTTTRFETAGEPIAETTRAFDDLGRLTNISTRSIKEGGDFYQSFDYTYNATNQRTRVAMEDGSYWEYQYDDLGQVISAKKYWRDGKPVAGQQFEYAFDGIGNRETAKYGGDAKGENLSEITYTKGTADATQIGTIEHPGTTYVTGKANEGAEVEVTAATVTAQPEIDRQGEYFSAPVTIDNTNGASVETINIAAREGAQSETTSRRAYVPARETQYLYDPDGNLLYDGRWHYEWDGENRLITMRAATEAVRGSRPMELQFAYDYIGRRISKRVVETIDGKLIVASDHRFVYDDWNLVAELDTTGRAFRTHLWGIDLSGSTQGAGGVGGLLSTATIERAVYISYDGNGNVTGELETNSGRLAATASYDAFGNVIARKFGSVTAFGFSTKHTDVETGFLYYGFRYYNPASGGWLSRDPIGEQGGPNLYGFTKANPISNIDYLGMDVTSVVPCAAGSITLEFDDCNSDQQEELGVSACKAYNALKKAVADFESAYEDAPRVVGASGTTYDGGMQEKANAPAEVVFSTNRFFADGPGGVTAMDLRFIHNQLVATLAAFDQGKVDFECECFCLGGASAYVWIVFAPSSDIHVCPSFFTELLPYEESLTLVHEVTHNVQPTTRDYGYLSNYNYVTNQAAAIQYTDGDGRPFVANADTYAGYVGRRGFPLN